MPTLNFGKQELATLNLVYTEKKLANGVDVPYRLAEKMFATAVQKRSGGRRGVVQWKVRRHLVGGPTEIDSGFEPIRLKFQPIADAGTFEDRVGVMPVGIGFRDEIENRDMGKIIELLAEYLIDNDMARLQDHEQQWLQGDVDGYADLITLNGADNTDGIIEAAAVGAQVNTVCGLSKSTYSTLAGFNNQFGDVQANFSSLGLPAIDLLALRIRKRAQGPLNLQGYASEAFMANYWRLLQPQERYGTDGVDAAKNGGSRIEAVVRGIPTCLVENMPDAGTATTAKPWSWLVLDHNSIQYDAQKGYLKKMYPVQSMAAAGNLARVGYMADAGQTVPRLFSTSGVIVDAETY